MNDEDSTWGGRLARYARVGATVGGIAARVAGERALGRDPGADQRARQLRAALGGLKGPLMKVGQFLAAMPDLLPPEYAAELQTLQSNAPSMGWPFVRRRMAAELGADWQSRFAHFDQTAIAAASLGQVHQARLPDGRIVACKLQYPDMASVVDADLDQLQLILSLFERWDGAVSTRGAHAEIADRLREELDYAHEAANTRLYRRMLTGVAGVHVPDVVAPLSTRRLLTLDWLEGERISDFADAHPDARDALALNLFRAWYVPFYHYGVIHGDPHPGNYSVRADGAINLFDFGCVRVFPPSFVKGVIDLYFALLDEDEERAVAAYRAWGFGELGREMVDTLNLWARFLYAPLLADRPTTLADEQPTAIGAKTMRQVHEALHRQGGVAIPRPFVFMDRAAIGLGALFIRLKARVNWYQVFHELIRDFDVTALADRQARALAASGLANGADDRL